MEFLTRIFDPSGFPARWQCGSGWEDTPWLGWLHILSDLGVWGAYVAIPLVLVYFLMRRRDLPFGMIFLLFGAFILACGTTHLIEAIIFWWPVYRLAGVVKFLTAVVSWATVISLFRVVPGVLTMRTPEELEREIAARKQAEDAMRRTNAELEQRVAERTTDLSNAVVALEEERELLCKTAAELRETADRLAAADNQKNEFLATLAHELRSPLAPLRNGLQIVERSGGSNPTFDQACAMMERQLGQLVHLVDDLLDVSRISRGKIELRKEPIELATVLHNAVETARPAIESKGHELSLNLPPEPVYVDADITRLEQVFANLLNNAVKYGGQSGHISLHARRKGTEVFVSVADDGIGIPADMMPKIFDMFTQADRTLERSEGGLGIGLTLVKRLVEMHGGTVTAHSEGQGRGSEFIVRLPTLTNSTKVHQPPEPASECTLTNRRILVVDDNRDAANSQTLLLQLMGNQVQTAHDGAEALERAATFKPDIILLDIGLPKMNGYDVCRAIRTQAWGNDILIVAVTGWGQAEDRRKSQEAGFDGHFVKPVDHTALVKLLVERRDPKPSAD